MERVRFINDANGLRLVVMPNGDLVADPGGDVPELVDGYVRDQRDMWRLVPLDRAAAARSPRRGCPECRGL